MGHRLGTAGWAEPVDAHRSWGRTPRRGLASRSRPNGSASGQDRRSRSAIARTAGHVGRTGLSAGEGDRGGDAWPILPHGAEPAVSRARAPRPEIRRSGRLPHTVAQLAVGGTDRRYGPLRRSSPRHGTQGRSGRHKGVIGMRHAAAGTGIWSFHPSASRRDSFRPSCASACGAVPTAASKESTARGP